jgi:hypothetical protein
MSSVEELKVRVGGTVAQTNDALAKLRGVGASFDEALNVLRFTATGTVHPVLLDAIVRLQQARERLNEAHALATGAVSSIDAWRSTA